MNANVSGQAAAVTAENHGLSDAQHDDIKCTVCQSNSHIACNCHLVAEPTKLFIGYFLEELIALPIPDRPHNLSHRDVEAYESKCAELRLENAHRALDASKARLNLTEKAINFAEALARDVVAASVQMAQMSQARAEERAERWAKESAERDVRAEKWAKRKAERAEDRAEQTEERANKRVKKEADSTEQ